MFSKLGTPLPGHCDKEICVSLVLRYGGQSHTSWQTGAGELQVSGSLSSQRWRSVDGGSSHTCRQLPPPGGGGGSGGKGLELPSLSGPQTIVPSVQSNAFTFEE